MSIDTFRIANESDAQVIAELVNRAYRPAYGAAGWTHESDLVVGDRTNPDQVTETITRPDSVILVGLNDSKIVACVHIEKEGGNSHIGMLAVTPTLQGAGAGKRILTQAESYALEIFGSEKFSMVVVSSRRELISFYLRRGYQPTGSIMDYPLSEGIGVPKTPALKIEVLEKRFKPGLEGDCAK